MSKRVEPMGPDRLRRERSREAMRPVEGEQVTPSHPSRQQSVSGRHVGGVEELGKERRREEHWEVILVSAEAAAEEKEEEEEETKSIRSRVGRRP